MIFRYNFFIREKGIYIKRHRKGAERMKEIIFKDTLQKYLVEKISKANNLLCSEEYRAGYIEALNEVSLYADFLSINKPKRL